MMILSQLQNNQLRGLSFSSVKQVLALCRSEKADIALAHRYKSLKAVALTSTSALNTKPCPCFRFLFCLLQTINNRYDIFLISNMISNRRDIYNNLRGVLLSSYGQ